jgi:DNA polymerase-3 subunit beta
MKFDCDVKTLAKAMGAVVRAVPNRATLPILGHVLLDATTDGLTLTATDLEVGVRMSIPAKVSETGATTAPAKLLAGVAGELNADRATFALKENRLRISAGRSSTTLRTMDADGFPPGPQPADGEAIRLPRADLLSAIEQVRVAVSTDHANQPRLTGVLLHFDHDSLTLVATDGHRLAKRELDIESDLSEEIIVPSKALAEVARLFRDEAGDIELRLSAARNQIFLRCGVTELASRLLDGQYLRYRSVIPTRAATLVRLPAAELRRAVRMVSVVAQSAEAHPVRVRVADGSVHLSSAVVEVGEAEAEIDADTEGEAVQIAFNANYLLDTLGVFDSDQVELRLDGQLSPGLVRAAGSDTCIHVLMPVRVTAPPIATGRSAAA